MISLKKYLDGNAAGAAAIGGSTGDGVPQSESSLRSENAFSALLAAYSAALLAVGDCGTECCPGLGSAMSQRMRELTRRLLPEVTADVVEEIDRIFQMQLREWSEGSARYYSGKAKEVKELLLVMARAAEAVSARDDRCASQMGAVTERLQRIATLDDVAEMRASVERGACELMISIERMTAEGKATVDELRKEVKNCQAKLEEAEELAFRDALTGVRNRMWVESRIEERIAMGAEFCVAIFDIDDFKQVNDTYGHVAGDELLKSFAIELGSTFRAGDVIGRWGGDEFIVLLDCGYARAEARIGRLCQWVCGDYPLRYQHGVLKLHVVASAGLAQHRSNEPLQSLIARADAAMYQQKAASRASKNPAMRSVALQA